MVSINELYVLHAGDGKTEGKKRGHRAYIYCTPSWNVGTWKFICCEVTSIMVSA